MDLGFGITFHGVTSGNAWSDGHDPVTINNGNLPDDSARPKGCRYWLMIADNRGVEGKGTPDIVGFAIHDRLGNRVSYGTGTVVKGDIMVAPA